MKFLNDVTITGSGADLSCAATVTFSNLPDSTETVSVMINSSGVLSKRTLGAAAFKGVAVPTSGDTDNVTTAGGIYTYVTGYAMPVGTGVTKWDGGSTGLTASTGRTSLGATTVGSNLFTLTNPGAIRFPRINANSTVSSLSASDFRTAIGATDTQLSNDAVIAAIAESTEISPTNKAAIKNNIDAAYSAVQVLDWTASQIQNIHGDNYTNTTYSVGDGGLTQNNFTDTLKSKLDGIDASANNYTLPAAATNAIGGVKIKSTTTNSASPASFTNTAGRTYAVQLASTGGSLVVNVPWSSGVSDASEIDDATTGTRGIMSASDKSKLDEIAAGATANVGDVTLAGAQTLSGAKTLSAVLAVSDSTASTSKTTGAVKITGGVGIQGALNVGADVVAFASSDERYKDNLQAIKNPIDKVKNLTGYTFTWNDKHKQFNGNNDIGVVAQEVEKVLPEIVDTRDNGYKAVKYEKIVAVLIEAIKDQQKQIDELKTICDGCSR